MKVVVADHLVECRKREPGEAAARTGPETLRLDHIVHRRHHRGQHLGIRHPPTETQEQGRTHGHVSILTVTP